MSLASKRTLRRDPLMMVAATAAVLLLNVSCAGPAARMDEVGGPAPGKWISLFNGKDLAGWKPSGQAQWTVEDGAIVGVQGKDFAPGDLFTEESYGNFLLSFKYRVVWPANSGVWFRYQNPNVGYQADILAEAGYNAYSGSLYCSGKMFIAPFTDPSLENHDGWNSMTIRAEGDHLQVWLNGQKTADAHDDSTPSGKLGIQIHPGKQFAPMKIILKDVKIKTL